MNFDVLVTVIVAISTHQAGMCYPDDRTKANPSSQLETITTTGDIKWSRLIDLFKLRNMATINFENGNSRFNRQDRKWRINKESTKNGGRVHFEDVDKVKKPALVTVMPLSRLWNNETNSSNIFIPPDKMDERIKSIMDPFTVLATTPPPSTVRQNIRDINKIEVNLFRQNNLSWVSPPPLPVLTSTQSFKNTIRTFPPKKVKLLQALLKKFRTKSSTDLYNVIYTFVDHFGKQVITQPPFTTQQQFIKSFLSLQEFDNIFTPSTTKYNRTDKYLLEDEQIYHLKNLKLLDSNVDHNSSFNDSLSSFAEGIDEITTTNYKPILSYIRSGDNINHVFESSLNSIVEKNLSTFIKELNNSLPDILPVTPITLTIDEDNDDIFISNNSRIFPIPALGKFVIKAVGKSKSFKRGPVESGDRKTDPFKTSNRNTTKSCFEDLKNDFLMPHMLRGSNLSYINGPVISLITEEQPTEQVQMKSSIGLRSIRKEALGKNFSVIKVLINYNSPDSKATKQSVKLPYKSLHRNKDQKVSDNKLLQSFTRVKAVKIPNINIYSYNISPTNNTSIHKNRKIWENNKIFSENPLNRLYEIKRFLNGTGEFLAIPFEVFSNAHVHLLSNRTNNLKERDLKDRPFSGQLKMSLDKYIHDREDSDNLCAKHTLRSHRKLHPTRFEMHTDAKRVKCIKCLKYSQTEKPQNTREDTGILEGDMSTRTEDTNEADNQNWKCTCDQMNRETERIRRKTDQCSHVHHALKYPEPTSTVYIKDMYDEEEVEEDYLMDKATSDFPENYEETIKFEDLEYTNGFRQRAIEVQDRRLFRTSCKCNKTKAPSRQDIIVSLLCGDATCPECTIHATDRDGESRNGEKIKTDSCLDLVQKETVCPSLDSIPPILEEPTICNKPQVPIICAKPSMPTIFSKHPAPVTFTKRPVPCPHFLKTKKQRCTCACLCGTTRTLGKKRYPTKNAKCRKNYFHIHPQLAQNSLLWKLKEREKSHTSTRKSVQCHQKFMKALSDTTITNEPQTTETYYTVTDIDINDYFSRTINHNVYNVTENMDESDFDYWTSDSDSDIDRTSLTDTDRSETYREFEWDLIPKTYEETYKTTAIDVASSTAEARCTCSHKKVHDIKNRRRSKIPCLICRDNPYEETGDNPDRIDAKYLAKYKTFGLDSSEITYGSNRDTYIVENIISGYKQATRLNYQTEETTDENDNEIVTLAYEGMEFYPIQTPTSLGADSITIASIETTPHSLLSPRERITLSTNRKRLQDHQKIRAVLTSNNHRKVHVKIRPLKAHTQNRKPDILINTRKETYSTATKSLSSVLLLKKRMTKSHLVNHADEAFVNFDVEKPLSMIRMNSPIPQEYDVPIESELISQPKEIIKSSEIASVKIVFGENNRKNVKKKRFNEKKKFFTFNIKL